MSKDISVNEEEIRAYCLNRSLYRPKTNVIAVAIVLIVLEGGIERSASWLLERVRQDLSLDISYIVAYMGITLLVMLLFGHWIAILLIKLYQRYAPESIRRKCICRPSCSEYAIVVLGKYGIVVGGYKMYIRLFHTCKGQHYVLDNPI